MQLTSAAVASASPLTSAEFEQLAQDVLALVQREHAHAEIDIPALTGKQFTPEETAQISDLLGLYFAEVATRAVTPKRPPKPPPAPCPPNPCTIG